MAQDNRKVIKITRDDLEKYARYTSPVTIGVKYKVLFDGTEPDVRAVSFVKDGVESDPYPAFACEVVGGGAADEKTLSLTLWKSRNAEAYDADGKLYTETQSADFAQDASFESIYDAIKANGKDALYECVGKAVRLKSQRGTFYSTYMRVLKKVDE